MLKDRVSNPSLTETLYQDQQNALTQEHILYKNYSDPDILLSSLLHLNSKSTNPTAYNSLLAFQKHTQQSLSMVPLVFKMLAYC